MVVAAMVATPAMAAAMLVVAAAVAMAVVVTSLATAAETLVVTAAMAAVAVDAAHARTLATHKAAVNQPSHACNKRRLHASAHSHLTKMRNRQAMFPQASRPPASLQAATAVTTAAVAVAAAAALAVVVVAADVRVAVAVAVKAVPATSARSTVVNRLVRYER